MAIREPGEEAFRRVWPLILEAVRMGRTVSYSELADRAGAPFTRRTVHRQLLEPLAERCRMAGLPNPAALVVRKDTGLPGGGWFDPSDPGDGLSRWAEALSECYAYRWPRTPPVTTLPKNPRART